MRLLFVLMWMSICAFAQAQEIVTLQWDPATNGIVAGYYVYYGTTSQNYTNKLDVGTNTTFDVMNLQLGTTYYFAVSSYSDARIESALSSEISLPLPLSRFLAGSVELANNVQYLQFTNGIVFGYYAVVGFPWIYHFDLGYEYVFESWNQDDGVYFYDLASKSFWYTSPSLFPYLYDFSLNSWLYYYPDTKNPGRYTSNPRYFYQFSPGRIITK